MNKKILIFTILGILFSIIYFFFISGIPWDLSTASYDNINFSILNEGNNPRGLFFKPDGTEMYLVNDGNNPLDDKILQYSLFTPWNISTATYNNIHFNITEDHIILGLSFNGTGTKMYITGSNNDSVYQYTLSQAWNLSTASYDNINLNISAQDSTLFGGIFFNSTGNKMYFSGSANDKIHQFTLSTAWDLSTATYDNVSFDVNESMGNLHENFPIGLFFNSSGNKMYLTGDTCNCIYQFTLNAPPTIALNNPKNNENFSTNSITFSLTPQDAEDLTGLEIKLYTNTSGSWTVNQTNSSVFNNTQTNFTINGIPDGYFIWGASVKDTLGLNTFSTNRTFIIDTISPLINFVSPTENSGPPPLKRDFIQINVTVSDANLANITIRLYNSTNHQIRINASATSPFFINYTGLTKGTYSFNATAIDVVNHQNSTETRTVILKP